MPHNRSFDAINQQRTVSCNLTNGPKGCDAGGFLCNAGPKRGEPKARALAGGPAEQPAGLQPKALVGERHPVRAGAGREADDCHDLTRSRDLSRLAEQVVPLPTASGEDMPRPWTRRGQLEKGGVRFR